MLCCCQGSPKSDRKTKEELVKKQKGREVHGQRNPGYESNAKKNSRPVSPSSVQLNNNRSNMDAKMTVDFAQLIGRLESVTVKLENIATTAASAPAAASPAAVSEELAAFVQAFDDMIGSGAFSRFMTLSGKIGGEVKEQADMVKGGFQGVRSLLVTASKCKEPSEGELANLLKPVASAIEAVQQFREKRRGSKDFNFLSAMNEGICGLGWVSVKKTPGPYVKEAADQSQFYTNKILKDFRGKDEDRADWAKAWVQTWIELTQYIKDHHTTGVSWNARGGAVGAATAAAPPPPPAGGAPPPPPPPAVVPPAAPASDGTDAGKAALFADLNKGTDVTKGLKKVTDDMKTHKNPGLRKTSPVTSGPTPYKKPTPSPKPVRFGGNAAPATKPPRFELDGKKWFVEYQVGNKNVVISETNIKQTVYIYKCQDTTVQVKGKVNSIVVDGCKKTALVFENVVAAVEFVNCQSVQAQALGSVPTVSIDKTDGCMVYLSKDCINADIVSAKSSEMNILIPQDSGEFKEFALPEQYKTKFDGKTMKTIPTDI